MKFKVSEYPIFPNYIWECYIPEIDNKIIKNYCLNLRDKSPGIIRSNAGGWHSPDLTKPVPDEIENLFEGLTEFVNKACSQKTGLSSLILGNAWVIINKQFDYNKPHDHKGSILSGVYYVDVPDNNMGDLIFNRDDKAEFYIKDPTISSFTNFTHSIKPLTSKFVIFPSWLTHYVERNESLKERISISFNFVYS